MEWEKLDGEIERARIPLGWLVRLRTPLAGDYGTCAGFGGLTFVPDPRHVWKIESKVEERPRVTVPVTK